MAGFFGLGSTAVFSGLIPPITCCFSPPEGSVGVHTSSCTPGLSHLSLYMATSGLADSGWPIACSMMLFIASLAVSISTRPPAVSKSKSGALAIPIFAAIKAPTIANRCAPGCAMPEALALSINPRVRSPSISAKFLITPCFSGDSTCSIPGVSIPIIFTKK